MRKFAIPFVLALILTGCAGTPTTNWIKTLAVACDSYGTSLTVLAAQRDAGKLSAPTVRAVNDIRLLVGPVCKPGATVPNPREAFFAITDQVHQLTVLKSSSES